MFQKFMNTFPLHHTPCVGSSVIRIAITAGGRRHKSYVRPCGHVQNVTAHGDVMVYTANLRVTHSQNTLFPTVRKECISVVTHFDRARSVLFHFLVVTHVSSESTDF